MLHSRIDGLLRRDLSVWKAFQSTFFIWENSNKNTAFHQYLKDGFSPLLSCKYDKKAKLCYTDANSFIVYVKRDHIYKDIAENVETRFDTSNYKLDILFPKEKNEKVIGLMKDKLNGKIMIKFVGLRAKT